MASNATAETIRDGVKTVMSILSAGHHMLFVWIRNNRRGGSRRRCAMPADARCAVGGFVRDRLLESSARKISTSRCSAFRRTRCSRLLHSLGKVEPAGQAFPVYKLGDVDVALPRRESKTGRGHKGFTVEGDPSMPFEEAARRRDFTINAIGWDPLTDEYLDPFQRPGRPRAPRPSCRRSDDLRRRLPSCPPCPAVCGALRADDRSGNGPHLLVDRARRSAGRAHLG